MATKEKKHTVKEVAKLSGVSVRTLHFYDEVGLLKPAFIGDNGYRYYQREQLLLLQQILFYRKLGFALDQIQKILSRPDFDKLAALRAHREALEKDRERVAELIGTIDKTITSLEGDTAMKAQDLYQGFTPEKQGEYEEFLVNRYGNSAKAHIEGSKTKTKGWSKGDWQRVQKENGDILTGLVAELEAGKQPDAPSVQALVQLHYGWICNFWTPNREAYIGLGQLYVDHPDFKKFYDPFHPQLVDFLARAMKAYAETNL